MARLQGCRINDRPAKAAEGGFWRGLKGRDSDRAMVFLLQAGRN
jgi:hypothetical protein